MSYLQEIGNRDKLAAVPETDRGLNGEEINDGSYRSKEPAGYQFTTDLLKMSSHSSVTISPVSVCSTEEKSREAA